MDDQTIEAVGYAVLTLSVAGTVLAFPPLSRSELAAVPPLLLITMGAAGGAFVVAGQTEQTGGVLGSNRGTVLSFVGGAGGAALPAGYGMMVGLELSVLQTALVPTLLVAVATALLVRGVRSGAFDRQRA